jgi:hypothetical protein
LVTNVQCGTLARKAAVLGRIHQFVSFLYLLHKSGRTEFDVLRGSAGASSRFDHLVDPQTAYLTTLHKMMQE